VSTRLNDDFSSNLTDDLTGDFLIADEDATPGDSGPDTGRFRLLLALIPNPIDQNPWAHWRSPMDMMRQG
jgi:hypothetical protein